MRTSLSSILRAVAILVATSVLTFCDIENVTGPFLLAVGTTADFVVEFGFDNNYASIVFLAMDVPVGWTVASCEYEGNQSDGPFEGECFAWEEGPWCDWGPVPVGYERFVVFAEGDFSPEDDNSWALATVRFNVDGLAGDYDIGFASGGGSGEIGCYDQVYFPVEVSYQLIYDDTVECGDVSRWSSSVP